MSVTIDGTSGITTPADSISGNLTFTGTGNRITGDMSNATTANRVTFQNSVVNGPTYVGAIPNGTSDTATFNAMSGSDPTNCSRVTMQINSVDARFISGREGTGTLLPMSFLTSGTVQMQIATDGTITGTKGNLQLISGTAVAAANQTSIDFTNIPSWVKRITIILNGISTNGTSVTQLQVGSGSVTTTGYVSSWAIGGTFYSQTTGFGTQSFVSASDAKNGSFVLTNVSGNTWISSAVVSNGATQVAIGTGSITLGGALDRVRFTTVNGTDTFDAGSINIMYE